MHPFRMLSLTLAFFLLSGALAAQNTSSEPAPPHATGRSIALVLNSLATQTGSALPKDVTLNGTVTIASGPNRGSGAITLSATREGKSQVSMNLPSGQQSEARNYSPMGRTGSWTGPDGASHNIAVQNILGPHPAWFLPLYVMKSGFMSTQYFAGDLGPATWEGASVEHLQIFRGSSSVRYRPSTVNKLLKQATQYDIYLDSSSLLPVAMTFNVHLDSDHPAQFLVPEGAPAGDVTEEVRFSDYQQVQGRPVAFHVQVYFNGALSADIHLASANFDTEAATAAGQQ